MRKSACVVLAATLFFPLMVSRAAPPDEEPVAASSPAVETSAGPIVKLLGPELPEAFRLPEEFESLPPEEREAALVKHLQEVYLTWRNSRSERPRGICLAGGEADTALCAAAARISYSRPCLAAGDCPALKDWKEVMGTPGLRPAPRSMARAADRSSPEPPERD